MDINYEELKLTDLIDRKILQKIQESFANMSGMAALTTEADGTEVTVGSNFSDFCMKYTRGSKVGCARCQKCDSQGAELALERGESVIYFCHAGLMDFAAPIMAEDKMVGCFIGGQVLTEPPDFAQIKKIAAEIGVDEEEYVQAAGRVNVIEQEKIDNAAKFLHTIADVLSEMAYHKYLVYRANIELERSSHMKSDFLANMSHEIRTPMNAVIGMAEMALREELPTAAKNYINQIKDAGKSLLTIINDILDFSKIESGKMDIFEVEYELMSMIYDVANIVMARLKEKDVELIVDIVPDLPRKLLGDNLRIKQILLNLTNNAAKFTSQGRIVLKVDYARTDKDEAELSVWVEDTGIGVKKEDIGKLFQSFQQVDSKRNRNIEGTGLGLAIAKRLLTLMDGNIWVESEYGRGSRFSFSLPQKIVDDSPSIEVSEPGGVLLAGLMSNPYVWEQFCRDAERLGVECVRLLSAKEFDHLPKDKNNFLFIEYPMFSELVEGYVRSHPQITAVLLIGFYDHVEYNIPNLLVVKKPLFALSIALILNGKPQHFEDDEGEKEFDFIAPDAHILIVDDNAVNLTVAEGLLEPLKMHVDTVTSGQAAIAKIADFHYDIVFMDHMMPELDGVETTHIIRRFHSEYNDVPIIALTANAVEGTKEMFCREGMNDFVAKPIEIRILVDKVRQWLPVEKIQKVTLVYNAADMSSKPERTEPLVVGDLDIKLAMSFLVNEDLFWKTLKVYYRSIEKKAQAIRDMVAQKDWAGYTIEVHALKSSSKQIGATSLSERAAFMEKAGNARDSEAIYEGTEKMLQQYLAYLPVLEPFCAEEEEDEAHKKAISKEKLKECFVKMASAVEDLDMDQMEEVIQDMNRYHYEGRQHELFTQLKEAVEEVDVDRCEEILKSWECELA